MNARSFLHPWHYLLVLFLFCSSFSASAFQFGLMEVPDDLEEIRDLVVTDPKRCIFLLKKRYTSFQVLLDHKSSPIGEILVSNSGLIRQLMSICLLKDKKYKQALLVLDSIQYDLASGFEASIRSKLIRALIYGRMGTEEKITQAKLLLEEGFAELSNKRGKVALRLKYQFLRELGRLASLRGNDPKAKSLLTKTLKYAELSSDNDLLGWANYFLADYYYRTKQLGMAMSLFLEAQKLGTARDVQSKYLAALASKRIALIYNVQKDFANAIPHAERSVQLFQSLNNQPKQIGVFMLLADLHRSMGQYNQALVHYINALDFAKQHRFSLQVAEARVAIGHMYIKLGQYPKARQQLELAFRAFKTLRVSEGVRQSLTYLGELNIATDNADKAIHYLESAEKVEVKDSPEIDKAEIYRLLAKSYEDKQLYHSALEFYKKQFNLSRLVEMAFNELTKESFALQYQLAEQKQHTKVLESNVKHERNVAGQLQFSVLIVTGVAVLFVLLFFIMKSRARKYKQKSQRLTQVIECHPHTLLPHAQTLESSCEQVIHDYSLQLKKKDDARVCLAVIKLDCFASLLEQKGCKQTQKLQSLLGRFLNTRFGELELYHLNEHMLLAMAPSSSKTTMQEYGKSLSAAFNRFTQQVGLPSSVSIGLCTYPFLSHAPEALSESQTLEVAYVALEGAKVLQHKRKSAQWLSLHAISGLHPAFIGGNVREQSKQAIDSGLIKVKYDGEKEQLDWLTKVE